MLGERNEELTAQAAVVGGGPAGLTAAVALAGAGVATVLVAPPHGGDNRTTALLGGSVAALATLGVWPLCAEKAAPLAAIRIVDDRGGLLRAPEVLFRAEEIGLAAFGHSIENRHLATALAARARQLPALEIIEASADDIAIDNDSIALRLSTGGEVRARLAIGADGRDSLCRRAAGIETETWAYPQTALTCTLAHGRAHAGISTEFHTADGPFTLVPLPGERSGLVWVTRPAEAARLMELSAEAFALAVERQAHSLLGKMQAASGRAAFPLSGQRAKRLAANRVALVGEAAHVIPPIGAQGLNLGLRDAATIAELMVEAHRSGEDAGAPDLLDRYERQRRADVYSRTIAVDLLNRSLLTDFLPLQGVRGLGLALVDSVGPLRRAVMREGVAPRASEPRLMRGEPL